MGKLWWGRNRDRDRNPSQSAGQMQFAYAWSSVADIFASVKCKRCKWQWPGGGRGLRTQHAATAMIVQQQQRPKGKGMQSPCVKCSGVLKFLGGTNIHFWKWNWINFKIFLRTQETLPGELWKMIWAFPFWILPTAISSRSVPACFMFLLTNCTAARPQQFLISHLAGIYMQRQHLFQLLAHSAAQSLFGLLPFVLLFLIWEFPRSCKFITYSLDGGKPRERKAERKNKLKM